MLKGFRYVALAVLLAMTVITAQGCPRTLTTTSVAEAK